jgi:hypothetical protein
LFAKAIKQISFCTIPFLLTTAQPAIGRTFIDIDVYGDKELRIAALNKLKQKVRDEILKDNQLAPQLLQLMIDDALGYTASTKEGGADGSVAYEEYPGRDNALAAVKRVHQQLQRTVSFSFADVCAVAGAEALETVGCPRIPVQMGRYDAKQANTKTTKVFWDAPTAPTVFQAFQESGLSRKDAVLLIGAVCEMQRIVDSQAQAVAGGQEGAGSDAEDEFEAQPTVPTSFGARDETFGSRIGSGDFGSQYLQALLGGDVAPGSLGRCLLSDPAAGLLVAKYAGNPRLFRGDVVEAYLRLTTLGAAYTTRNS